MDRLTVCKKPQLLQSTTKLPEKGYYGIVESTDRADWLHHARITLDRDWLDVGNTTEWMRSVCVGSGDTASRADGSAGMTQE